MRKKMKWFWAVAYTMYGDQFGISMLATNREEFLKMFEHEYPDCDFADYGWDELEEYEYVN